MPKDTPARSANSPTVDPDEKTYVGYSVRLSKEMLGQLEHVTRERQMPNIAALVRLYLADGLAKDLEKLQWSAVQTLVEALREEGIDNEVLQRALNKAVAEIPESR